LPTAAETKTVNALISLYEKLYAEKYGKKPLINRYKDKWGFQDMLKDLGPVESKEIIQYYFETHRPGHPLLQLFRNYDDMVRRKLEREKDEVDRKKLRAETKLKVQELNERTARITTD